MAVKEEVNVKVSADMAEALAAWKEIENGPRALEDALKRIGELEASSSTKWATALEGIVAKWLSIATAIKTAKDLMQSYFETERRIGSERVTATRDVDAAYTRYLNTAGIRRGTPEAQQAYSQIASAAISARATPAAAFDMGALLQRAGAFSEANLAEGLRLQDVSAQTEGGDVSGAAINILYRHGVPITPENLRSFGGTAYSLMQSDSMFSLGMMEEYQKVAGMFRGAGYSLPMGLSMWAATRPGLEPKQAVSMWRGLLDENLQPGEPHRIAAIEQQARAMAAFGGGYETAIANADESMATREQGAATGATFARVRRGVVGREEAQQNLVRLLESLNLDDTVTQRIVEGTFENPFGPDWLYSTEGRAEQAAWMLNRAMNEFDPSIPRVARPGAAELRAGWVNQIMGRQEIVIRQLSSDGRDIPIQVEANGLNQDFSNDATQDRR